MARGRLYESKLANYLGSMQKFLNLNSKIKNHKLYDFRKGAARGIQIKMKNYKMWQKPVQV